CAACHDPAEVAKSTADRGRKNPHISPHWGTEVPCWVCHKEHAKDENYCLICHTW
ncbi:cytochrome c3 family protein, partial [uncultured Bilophila sp.]